MERAGVKAGMTTTSRVPWNHGDAAIQGAIKVHAFAAYSELQQLPMIETALRTLPGIVHLRVIRGPQDYIGKEDSLRPQVIAYVSPRLIEQQRRAAWAR